MVRMFVARLMGRVRPSRLGRGRRRGTGVAFHVAFVVATIGLSLVVTTGLAVLITALLGVLVRPPWRTEGGTA